MPPPGLIQNRDGAAPTGSGVGHQSVGGRTGGRSDVAVHQHVVVVGSAAGNYQVMVMVVMLVVDGLCGHQVVGGGGVG